MINDLRLFIPATELTRLLALPIGAESAVDATSGWTYGPDSTHYGRPSVFEDPKKKGVWKIRLRCQVTRTPGGLAFDEWMPAHLYDDWLKEKEARR